MKKVVKKLKAAIILSGLLVCNCVTAYGYDNIENNINNIQQQINECMTAKENAHTMADSARNLGLSETDEVILKAQSIYTENAQLQKQLESELQKLKAKSESLRYIGNFKLTAYCPCSRCSSGTGITASGAIATEGVTIAADTRILPIGTKVYIDGIGERIVQDTGSAIKSNKIDIYLDNHSECFGSIYNRENVKVWVIE